MKIITISGLSGSGKSKLADQLKSKSKCIEIISLDNYSFTKEYLKIKYNEIDFSSPQAFNKALLNENIKILEQSGFVEIPLFDINTQILKNIQLKKPKTLIIEGMFAQSFLENFITLNIYVDIDLDIALIRKIKRDTKERNRDIGFIINEHLNYTRKNIKHVIKQKEKCSFIFENNEAGNNFILDDLINYIDV